MADGVIVQGDLLPSLVIYIEDSDKRPVDLTGASAKVRVKGPGLETFTDATILDVPGGIIRHDWTTEETAKVGTLKVTAVIDRAGKPQTYPGMGALEIAVRAA